MKSQLKNFTYLTLSTLVMAVGIYFFKFSNNFTFGGITGLAVLIAKSGAISAGDFSFAANMVLLVIGFFILGRKFAAKTAYSSILLSVTLSGLERIYPMSQPLTSQPLLELAFAIALPSIGSAVLFNIGASSGGTDIVAMILKKYTGLDDIGKALFVSDGLIAVSACWLFGMKTGLFSLLGLFLKAFVVDSVIESINLCKFFAIVTSKPQEICDYIIQDMNRSSTVIDAMGAYTHAGCKVVLIACRRGEAEALRQKC